MSEKLCTIYDCEMATFYDGVISDQTVFLLDSKGKRVPARDYLCEHVDFDMVQFFTGNYDRTGTREKEDTLKWGYFQLSTGRVVVDPTYEYAYPFYGDRAKVRKNGKYGFLSPDGKEVVEPIWEDTANAFHHALCWVKAGVKFGYINKEGEVVWPPQFEEAKEFQFIGKSFDNPKYAALVKMDGKYGYIDEKGTYIFEPGFEDAREFWRNGVPSKYNAYAPVMVYDQWAFIDANGDFVIAFQFDDVGQQGSFTSAEILNQERVFFGKEHIDFYTVQKDGQWGLIDSSLAVIMPIDSQRYVAYRGMKIYIKDGKVTSIKKIKSTLG